MKHPVLVSRLAVLLLVVVLLLGVFPSSTPPAEAVSFTLVISQFQVGGSSLSDEFIELHNVTKDPIDLNGHKLVFRAEAATTDTLLKSWTVPTIVPAGAYYLVAATSPAYDDSVQPDTTMTGGTLAGRTVGLRSAMAPSIPAPLSIPSRTVCRRTCSAKTRIPLLLWRMRAGCARATAARTPTTMGATSPV